MLTENRRALDTVERLRQGDLNGVGELLIAARVSLRDDYKFSCSELDLAPDGVLNARLWAPG